MNPVNLVRIRDLLARHGLSATIGTSPENIRYASGHECFQGVWNRFPKAVIVSVAAERPILVLPIGEIGFVVDRGIDQHADLYFFGSNNIVVEDEGALGEADHWILKTGARSYPGISAALAAALREHVPEGRVAVDRTGAAEIFNMLAESEATHAFVDRGEDFWRIARMVKTDEEIASLQRAVTLNEAAIDAVHARLGLASERELAASYAAVVCAAGGFVQHWSGATAATAGSFRDHTHRVPTRGDRFRFDCGLMLEGYCSDIGGTAQIGVEPSALERRTYEALTAGIDEALSFIRPGVRTTQIYQRVIEAVRKGGLPDYRYSLVGHGIGVEPRDYPVIAGPIRAASPFWEAPYDIAVEKGMVLNIECPLNILGKGGFQHEVTLVVGDGENCLLSQRRPYRVTGY